MLLQARHLVVRHHPSLPPAVADVSLDVAGGEIVAVVGSNGSGKSTLARALVGLQTLEGGQIWGAAPQEPARVGLVVQDPAAQLIAVTVADELALGPEGAGEPPLEVRARVAALLARHELGALHARDPARLSGGQQQRVAMAAIEACDADVLVLDEPTALLDPLARARLRENVTLLVAERRRGVVWITQQPDDIATCTRVVVLDAGVVAWRGTSAEYVSDPQLAVTWGLELPAAARIAHALGERDAWPAACTPPLQLRDLVEQLVTGGDPRG